MIFIIHDLFSNLNNFVDHGISIGKVLYYYVALTPSLLIFILPISLLLATLYSLYQLTHNNELTAMRASGISLYRLMTPFVVIGLSSTAILMLVNETLGPRSAFFTELFLKEVNRGEDEPSAFINQNLVYRNAPEKRIWEIERFDTKSDTYRMDNVTITQVRKNSHNEYRIVAERAEWLDGRWTLYNFSRQDFDENGYKAVRVDKDGNIIMASEVIPWKEMDRYNEQPRSFINEMKDPDFMSYAEMEEYLSIHPDISPETKAKVTTNMHMRIASPFTALIVILLGIPFGTHTARKGALIGVLLCLGLFFTYYMLIPIFKHLGHQQIIPAFVAAWVPNIFFCGLGAVLLYRMR
jgi:LPS export ABC transporter permease LptG